MKCLLLLLRKSQLFRVMLLALDTVVTKALIPIRTLQIPTSPS